MDGMAQRFAEALRKTEETRDPEHVAALFGPDCELSNLAHRETGLDGARRFWSTYLNQFDEVRSDFSHLIEQEGQAALAWTSEGAVRGGTPIRYRGVSLLEHDGQRVRRFETVYDSAAFLQHPAESRSTDA